MRYLNLVRERAGVDPVTNFTGFEDLTLAVRCERARELGGEFQRKFDLVRWGIWYAQTYAYTHNATLKGKMRPCHRYYPIPDAQCALSGYVLTNDEYLATAASKAYSDIDFPMIRLGEIYLIYAEACMNLGQANTALPKLKELTDRAGVSAPSSVTADYLLEERARELMWEGHRRTDLLRYGKFTTPSFLWTYKGGTFTGQGFDDYMKIFAIPSSELASNPELHQNPGYGNATDK